MSIKVYKDGKLQQVAGNADTRLTKDDVISILGYTPADSSKIGVSEGFATLDSNGKLSESQKPIYDWSEINNIPSVMDAATISLSCTGNSASATQLETSRVLTIGNTGKSFNGTSDVSWTLDEMGVAPSSHSHGASDLPYFIANNDTTIDVTLSAVGWYRIAIWGDGTPVNAAGSICNSCEIIFKRQYSNVNNEYHKISLLGIYQKSNFVSELSKSNTQLITKIRHVVDTISNVSYIEFYYNGTNSNALAVTLNNATSRGRKWTLITPELTDETADGVTVYSTMDIPANSSGTASYDGDGNVITDTYATKTEISPLTSNLIPHQRWYIPAGETRRVLVREANGPGNLVLFSTYFVIPSYKTIFLASSGNGNNTNSGQNITITTLLAGSQVTVSVVNERGYYNCFDITNNGSYAIYLHANTLYGTQPVMYE